jgi:hypothetical protein
VSTRSIHLQKPWDYKKLVPTLGTMPKTELNQLYKKDRAKSSWMIDGAFKLTMWVEQPSGRADLARFLAWCLKLALAFCSPNVFAGECFL